MDGNIGVCIVDAMVVPADNWIDDDGMVVWDIIFGVVIDGVIVVGAPCIVDVIVLPDNV